MTDTGGWDRRHRLQLAALVLVAIVFHMPSIEGPFIDDDVPYIAESVEVHEAATTLGGVWRIFGLEYPTAGLYRPLTGLFYAVQWRLWSDAVLGFHVVSLALWVATGAVAWAVLRRLTSERLAFTVALFYVAHPAHTEVVDHLTGQSDLLSGLFLFLALLTHARTPVSVALFALSVFSKESGAILPGLLFVQWTLLEPRVPVSRAVVRLLPYIGVVAAFAALRTNAIGGFVADVVTLEDPTFVGWAATLGGVAVHYLGILLAPAELQTDRYYKVAVGVRQAFDAQAWLGVGALVLLGAVAGWDIVRTRRVGGPARLAYGIGFAAVAMGPYAHIVPFGAVMAERFLHIGLFGFAWCLGVAGMALLRGRERLGPLLVSAVVLSWGFRSALRSSDWQSAVYVWEPVVRAIPNDGYAQFSLGHSLLSEGRIEEGRAHLERAVALNPTNGSGKNLLAITMLQQGEVDAAEALFQAATTAPDDRTHAFNGLGTVAERRGKLVTALGYFEQAMKLDPTQRLARDNVARTQERIARAEAIRAAIEPGPAESPERLRELDAACQALEDQPCRVAVAALLAEGSTSGADFH